MLIGHPAQGGMAFLFYFHLMNFICLNGKILQADKPALMVDNKSYRYGDGLFETMKVTEKKISLGTYHFERFFSGLKQMDFETPTLFTQEKLEEKILLLCEKNKSAVLGRVRLSVFRGNGGVFEGNNDLHYVIECWPVDPSVNQLNENGFVIDVYPDARKSCDVFSNIKSANYLPYIMAARYAKENKLNECLVLNIHDRIADGTIANFFLVKDEEIMTPPLSEGCVNGVMRRWLMEQYQVKETVLTIEDVLSADELFLTNAMYGIRWVKQFRNKMYNNLKTSKIHDEILKAIWS